MTASSLVAVLGGEVIGRLTRDTKRRPNAPLSFAYDPAWRASPDAHPLSLSMPLAAERHGHDVVEPFAWGLLPDNDRVLD